MNIENTKHAKFSASGSERWLNCPGSIALSEFAPPQASSPYADEGTKAHACLEMFFKNGIENAKATKTFLLKTNPKEMVDHAYEAFIEFTDMTPENADVLSELKLDLSEVVGEPDTFGTADVCIMEPFGKLIVGDFKYGAGVAVDAKDNTQLLYYALGAAAREDFMFSKVEVVIIQPRAYHPDGPIRKWTYSIEELQAWADKFKAGITAAKEPGAPLVYGEKHCKFCPAKTICPEISDKAFKQAALDFAPLEGMEMGLVSSDIETPDVVKYSHAEIGEILKAIPKIETWIDAVKERAFTALEQGEKVEGFKLVEKRGTRKWTDTTAVVQYGMKNKKDPFCEPEILSPAQFEKRHGKSVAKFVEENTTSVSSGMTMVPESDPRPATTKAALDFDPVDVVLNVDFDSTSGNHNDMVLKTKSKKKKAPVSEADWKAPKKKVKPKFARQHRAGVVKKTNPKLLKRKKRK